MFAGESHSLKGPEYVNQRTNGPVNAHLTIGQVYPQNHSNQFLPEQNKNTIYVEDNGMNLYENYQLHPSYCFCEEDLLTFLLKFTLFVALATNQIQGFGQNTYKT